MRSLRILILAFVFVVLLLPTVAYADGPYYTINTPDSDPNGTGSPVDPRRATNASELAAACKFFGGQLGADKKATLYWVLVSSYDSNYFEYELKILNSDGTCDPVGGLQPGVPPGYGVRLPPSVIIGGLIALGLLVLGVAWLLRRRLRAGARLT